MQEADLLRAAFRDVHGAGLHGFALLLTLGDRSRAASVAATALAEGVSRVDELRHPERAAAWLRGRALSIVRRTAESGRHSRAERSSVLLELGMREAAIDALRGLSLEDRAALIASSVEGFSTADLAAILDRDLEATRRILRSARRRYLSGATHWLAEMSSDSLPGGATAARVEEVASLALGTRVGGFPR